MSQRRARRGWSAAAGVAAIAVVACGQTAPAVFIHKVLAPPAAGAAGSVCTYGNSVDDLQLSAGTVDVGLRDSYHAVLLVGSQINARASAEQVRVETAQLLIEGAEVHVFDAKENELRAFTRLANATIDPAGSGIHYNTVDVDILDAESIREAASGIKSRAETRRLVVHVSVFGHTMGGIGVETPAYQFPIDVCNGCLVSFKDAPDEPTLPGPDCRGDASSLEAITPCYIGQDQKVSCWECQGFGVCELG